ncbi:MAG: hypothetical protein KBD24_02030 [Candidatus Pacebacteria bacterium]|nr:hypothetical protein [Candidatus Paceibacterota bacterium]
MNYRLNSHVIAIVALLAFVAIGLFVFTLVSAPADVEVVSTGDDKAKNETIEQIIAGKHQYVGGVHTIAGLMSLPTPCHSVVVEPFFPNANATSTVEIRFTTVLSGETCPAIVSDAPYRVTFNAPENVEISATWDGKPVRLNLVPIAEGESLGEEFYFKG